MSAARFYLDRRYATIVIVALVAFLSYDLADYLLRIADQPRNLQELAGRQLESLILAGAVGSALTALLAARHSRFSGRDYTVTAARTPLRRTAVQFVSAAVPLSAGWILFVVVSGVRSGLTAAAFPAVAVIAVSIAALFVSVAIGQFVGAFLRPFLAVPAAFVASYLFAATFSIVGDDSWMQWLGTGFGDQLSGTVQPMWVAGEIFWFAGVTLALLGGSAATMANPRRLPSSFLWVTGLLLVVGIALLSTNGASATTDEALGGL
ncbi:hypothetical protein ABNF97_27495 [Plantactinospora sp. B6F1]|uniref:hypothetical protein n=1 Tax=Plantactinospora sp. B6F1 TaxID=3158971 RepID=UPI0032D8B562